MKNTVDATLISGGDPHFRTTSSKPLRATALGAMIIVIVAAVISAALMVGNAEASHGSFQLPFDAGKTFYVCQGYQSSYTHKGTFALDLTAGGTCNTTASSGMSVRAPFTGTVQKPSSSTIGELCLSSNDGIWVRLVHINTGLQPGTTVAKDQIVGTVAAPYQRGNGGTSHIHIEAYRGAPVGQSPCWDPNRNRSIPFDISHGTTLSGYSMPDDGRRSVPGGQYKGKALTRPSGVTAQPVIVDDLSSGFSRGGPTGTCSYAGSNTKSWYWCWQDGGYNNHYWYTWNGSAGSDVNFGVWRPNLVCRATYRLYVYIPENHAYTTQARYKIVHANGTTQVNVNQQPLVGWKDLGAYTFNGGTGGFLYLGDTTGEGWAMTQIGMDAAQWVPVSGCF